MHRRSRANIARLFVTVADKKWPRDLEIDAMEIGPIKLRVSDLIERTTALRGYL